MFTQKSRSPVLVVKAIVAEIRDRVCLWGRVRCSYEHDMLCRNWSISPCTLVDFRGGLAAASLLFCFAYGNKTLTYPRKKNYPEGLLTI